MRTTAHQIILLLLCYDSTAAGSLFHRSSQRQPVVSSIPSHTPKQTHHHQHYTRAFFQLVPRGGGGGDDDETNHKEDKEINVAKEYYYQELSKQLQSDNDDDDVSSSDESYNYDVEVYDDDDDNDTDEESHHQSSLPLDPILLDPTEIKGEKEYEYYNDGKEEEDGMTKLTILPKFLFSSHHFTSTVPSTMIHIANVVLQAAKRSLLAGARAITQVERNIDDDHNEDAVKNLMVDDEEGPRRPVGTDPGWKDCVCFG